MEKRIDSCGGCACGCYECDWSYNPECGCCGGGPGVGVASGWDRKRIDEISQDVADALDRAAKDR